MSSLPEGSWIKIEVTISGSEGEVLFPCGVKRLITGGDGVLTNRATDEILRLAGDLADEAVRQLTGAECFVFEYRGHWRWAFRSPDGSADRVSSEHYETRWEAVRAAEARGCGIGV